jgi:signal peptidase II
MSRVARVRLVLLALSAGVVLLDYATKRLVEGSLAEHIPYAVLPGILQLTRVHNRGAAFGLLNTANLPHQPLIFAVVSLVALTAMLVYSLRLPATRYLPQTALSLIFGGAIGNLIDRLRYGYVIDFIDVYWGTHHWPMFNAADSAISVGVGLLILDMLREPHEARPEETAGQTSRRTE